MLTNSGWRLADGSGDRRQGTEDRDDSAADASDFPLPVRHVSPTTIDHQPSTRRRCGLLVSALAIAASPPLSAAVLEEITVTAQKRQEALQDVGISVTAFSADQLRAIGATSTTDISQQVPSLQLVTFTPAFTIFSLRGVSQANFQDNLEAPVAVYLDGAYVASMNAIGTQLYDMERVEVLRGPQGTLFGRNTTGGLIHYLTRGADDEAVNGYLEGTVADYEKYAVEGAIGGALGDRARARVAGRWEESDGYVESITPGIRDAHGANGYSLRGSLQFDFTENFTGDLRVGYADDSDVPSGAYTVRFATFDPDTGLGIPDEGGLSGNLEHASTLQGGFDRETYYGTGTLTWDLGGDLELVSITNYMNLEKNYLEDAGGGFGFFPYNTIADFDQFSQELRLSGEAERSRWQIGAYYLDMTWDLSQSVAGALILGGESDTQRMDTLSVIDSKNWSVFAQAEFDLTSTVTLIAGARWSQDDKEIEMSRVYQDVPEGIPPTEVFNIGNVAIPGIDEIDYGDYAARLQLNWSPNDDMLLYASVNRGIKGGNWSIDPLGFVPDEDLRHEEEVLTAWEIGSKTTFGGGLARLNMAAFYYDYDDFQTFSINLLTPQVSNSDAESYGGEIELAFSPGEGWDFLIGAAFLDSEVEAVPDVFGGTVEAEFPTAPSVSLNFLGRYEWSALGGVMYAQIDGVYNDDQYLEGTNSAVSFEESYSVWNAHLGYTTGDGRWNLAVWMKNFTDEEYRLYNLDLGLLGFIEQVYAPPAWWGGSIAYRWE